MCNDVYLHDSLVRATSKFEAMHDELDDIHNGLIMWKHYGGSKHGQAYENNGSRIQKPTFFGSNA